MTFAGIAALAPLTPDEKQQRLRDGVPLAFAPRFADVPETIESEQARTVDARWIEALVSTPERAVATKIEIRHAIIDGELRLEHVTFQDHVILSDCVFRGAVSLACSTFNRTAKFDDSRFEQGARFRFVHTLFDLQLRGCVFMRGPRHEDEPLRGENDFKDLRIDGVVNATGATFADVAFDRSSIAKSAFFGPRRCDGATARTVFNGYARFGRVAFGANAHFSGAIFQGPASFRAASFGGNALFTVPENADGEVRIDDAALQTTFHDEVSFEEAIVRGSLYVRALFEKPAAFAAIHVEGQTNVGASVAALRDGAVILPTRFLARASFWRASFDGNAEFHGVEFNGPAEFGLARFGSDVRFRPWSVNGPPAIGGCAVPVRFRAAADFLDASVRGVAQFAGVQFESSVRLERMKIEGSLNFGYTTLEPDDFCCTTTVHGPANLNDLEVLGIASFTGATFIGEASFNRLHVGSDAFFTVRTVKHETLTTRFRDTANFIGARIDGTAVFDGARFETAVFRRMKVGGDASWSTTGSGGLWISAAFGDQADFASMIVGGAARFSGARFTSANFSGAKITSHLAFPAALTWQETEAALRPCRFDGPVRMIAATVGGDFDVSGARFDDTLNADRLDVAGSVFFRPATFQSIKLTTVMQMARFWGARFRSAADFSNAVFNGTANFMNAAIDAESNFEGVHFNGETIFVGATLGVARFGDRESNRVRFASTVDLRGCKYDGITMDWRRVFAAMDPYDRQPYNQLERFFRSAGNDADASAVYVERRRRETRIARDKVFGRSEQLVAGPRERLADLRVRATDAMHLVSQLVQGGLFRYGVRPIRLLVLTLAMLAVAAVVFHTPGAVTVKSDPAAATARLQTLTQTAPDSRLNRIPLTWAEAAGFSIRTFSLVDLPIATGWAPSPVQRCCLGLMTVEAFAAVHRLLGAIFVPLGIAGLTGLLVRKEKSA